MENEHRRSDDYVTKEVCEIKEKNFADKIDAIALRIEKAVLLMERNDEHHREIQSKLFDKMEKKVNEEHIGDNSHINITTVSLGLSIVTSLCLVLIWIIEKVIIK